MLSWLLRTTRALVAPDHQISCAPDVWEAGQVELRRRGGGHRESGAFLLGTRHGDRRRIERFVYYDSLDPGALDTGIVDLDGSAYGPLWSLCRETGLSVVADVHTHPNRAFFSPTDRANPMIAEVGHLAIVLPSYAQAPFSRHAMGDWALFEYGGTDPAGRHLWREHPAHRRIYVGRP